MSSQNTVVLYGGCAELNVQDAAKELLKQGKEVEIRPVMNERQQSIHERIIQISIAAQNLRDLMKWDNEWTNSADAFDKTIGTTVSCITSDLAEIHRLL